MTQASFGSNTTFSDARSFLETKMACSIRGITMLPDDWSGHGMRTERKKRSNTIQTERSSSEQIRAVRYGRSATINSGTLRALEIPWVARFRSLTTQKVAERKCEIKRVSRIGTP